MTVRSVVRHVFQNSYHHLLQVFVDHVDGCDTLPMLHSLPSPASLQLLLQGALVGPGEDLNDGRLGVQPQANPVTQREIDGCSAFEQALTPALKGRNHAATPPKDQPQ